VLSVEGNDNANTKPLVHVQGNVFTHVSQTL